MCDKERLQKPLDYSSGFSFCYILYGRVSKVTYNGKTGYMVNTRLNKSGLSKYRNIIVGKGSTYNRVVKGKIKYTKKLNKDRKFRIMCYITEGKYKGYYCMYRNTKYYLIK